MDSMQLLFSYLILSGAGWPDKQMKEQRGMEQKKNFIIKGNMVFSGEDRSLKTYENQYLVCVEGKSEGIFKEIPEAYRHLPLMDYTGKMVIPGMTDLHVHAPQYSFRGLGMDLELLDWLNTYTFPEEGKYADTGYADGAYGIFVRDLKNSFTTRACIFATVHTEATFGLMQLLEESGLITFVGKVNMDRNATPELCGNRQENILKETESWIQQSRQRFTRTMPILTPRFIPSCTDALMEGLGKLREAYKMPMQSHLSENPAEVAWVKELVPAAETYSHAYAASGMFGEPDNPAIMAHCVYLEEAEIRLMKEKGVFVAHCPDSNLNLASGIAPIRRYLSEGIHVGLGSDVAGGTSLSMPRAMALAIQSSKMYWRLVDQSMECLRFEEAFYLATIGGGSYFGKVGSLDAGYEADFLVVDDSPLNGVKEYSLSERAQRLIYFADDCSICAKYVKGYPVLG